MRLTLWVESVGSENDLISCLNLEGLKAIIAFCIVNSPVRGAQDLQTGPSVIRYNFFLKILALLSVLHVLAVRYLLINKFLTV